MSLVLKIEGMSCRHCAEAVRKALVATPGVEKAEVDVERGEAVIEGGPLDANLIREAVEDAGYSVAKR